MLRVLMIVLLGVACMACAQSVAVQDASLDDGVIASTEQDEIMSCAAGDIEGDYVYHTDNDMLYYNGLPINGTVCFANGPYISREPFKDGKNDGVAKTYRKNGILISEQSYSANHEGLHGVTRQRDQEGNLLYEQYYKDGRLDGVSVFYYNIDGIISVGHEMPYKQGRREGIAKLYDQHGALEAEITYYNDEAVGGNYSDGSIMSKEELQNKDEFLSQFGPKG